jgi:uridine kinase
MRKEAERRTLRVFISSPEDVRPERLIAERVVRRIDQEFSTLESFERMSMEIVVDDVLTTFRVRSI